MTASEGRRREERLRWLFAAAVVALVAGAYLAFTLRYASYTLGCDYLTYDAAARRWLAGAPLYDLTETVTGTCGIYQYPPSFIAVVLPFTLLPPDLATWAWIAASLACVVAATALLPVPPGVRLATLGIALTSWPLLFAIKVGAVGPLLLLVFGAAWRWLDRPGASGLATAGGVLAKLQPGLLLAWMVLTGRWRAAVVGIVAVGVVAAAGFALAPGTWLDFLATVRTLSATALEVPTNVSPASLAWHGFGLSADGARLVGGAHTLAVAAAVLVAARRCEASASVLVTAVASQLVAPVVWDHYAVVVFLPMAWLLARGHAWAALGGLALNAMLILWFPIWGYVALMDLAILALLVLGRRRAAGRTSAWSLTRTAA